MQVLKTVKDIKGCSYYGKGSSSWYGKVMEDGKIFSPTIHKRYLPSKYLGMIKDGYLLPVSPTRFTWAIRRWLGAEVSSIIAMRREGILEEDYKMKMYLLGKDISKYLLDSTRLQISLFYGKDIGHRSGKEWVYLVSEEWIVKNFYELYNSYLAMGCYYTITSLHAYGKLKGVLEATIKGIPQIFYLSSSFSSDEDMRDLANSLKNDKEFRESLSRSCLNKVHLSSTGGNLCLDIRLKNVEGALENYHKFYSEQFKTKKATRELYNIYSIPTFGVLENRSSDFFKNFYVE